jgi:hypothetical protein
MKKQLNVNQIQSELRAGSAFFPGYKGGDSPTLSSQETEKAAGDDNATSKVALHPGDDKPKEESIKLPEQMNTRTPVRPSSKRIITRNSFEIYEDQMDTLRKLSLQEKMEGKLGSMSRMVRAAIDSYLEKKASTT